MRRLTILQPYEAHQFDLPPQFNQAERHYFFSTDALIETSIKKTHGTINSVGLLLQYGYFRASGKFYTSEKFHLKDIAFVAKQLNLEIPSQFAQQYADNTRLNHKGLILSLCGYQKFKEQKKLFCELTEDLVAKQLAPRKIIFSLIDLLRDKKIEVPHYDTFATVISEAFNHYEKNNIVKLTPLLTEQYKKSLMQLIDKEEGTYQRPLLVGLKTISHSIRPVQIKKSIHGFMIIKKLYGEIEDIIVSLDLSPEAIRYYAQWVSKAKVTQLSEMKNDTQC